MVRRVVGQLEVLRSITRASGAEGGYLTRMAALYLASTSYSASKASRADHALSEAPGLLIGSHMTFNSFPSRTCFVVGEQRDAASDAACGREDAFGARGAPYCSYGVATLACYVFSPS